MKILVMTGPPYSGKGTQCEKLAKEIDYAHLSTGEAIRKEKDDKTELGKLMSQWQDEGKLVPDEVMEEFVEELINQRSGSRGIILDAHAGHTQCVADHACLLRRQPRQLH